MMKTLIIYLCALLLSLTEVTAPHGGAATGGGTTEHAQKVQNALINSDAAIQNAVSAGGGRVATTRATTLSQTLAEAAIDDTVSPGAMETMVGLAGPRRILGDGHFERGDDDRIRAVSYEVESRIGKAVAAGTPYATQQAARSGRDMGIVATTPVTYFTVDHVKDMDMDSRPKRLLRGVADARTSIESLWAMQDTAEAIEAIGAKGTKLGTLQAGAASGHRGNTAMSQKMLDTITHQEAVDNKGGGRPRRLKAIV